MVIQGAERIYYQLHIKKKKMNENEFTAVYAKALFEFVKALKKEEDDRFYGRIKRSILVLIREYTDSFPVEYASQKAIDKFEEYRQKRLMDKRWKNSKQIFDLHYKDRDFCGYKDGLKGKPTLVLDHTTPVNKIRDEVLTCKNDHEIIALLTNNRFLCWITRDEDNRLNGNKLRNERHNGWTIDFETQGIQVRQKQNV